MAAPPGSVLPVHDTVTLRLDTLAVGVLPVGIETAFAVWAPEPLWFQAALAPAAGAARAIATARTIGRWRPSMASTRVDQLEPVSVTGIVNVTPVVVQPEWPASAVIEPLPVTAVTVTA